jgi:hypothetical protein
MNPRQTVPFAALLLGLAAMPSASRAAQNTAQTSVESAPARPLPDIPTLMHQVESRQRLAETVQKDYLYRESTRVDDLDGHGAVKKSETRDFDVFWIEGVPVRKLVRKDGKDLSPDDLKKESERIDKEVAKARERRAKADADGKETDAHGHDEVTVSRMLELGAFTNPRRESVRGRDTIAVDFTGDPKAKTRNAGESAIHDMAGTVWIDEADQSIARVDGRFVNPFKIGGGLLVNVHKDTTFSLRNRKVNDEVWLPESLEAHGQARIMLFMNVNGSVQVQDGDYRKFKATSTILPATPVEPEQEAKPEPKPPN